MKDITEFKYIIQELEDISYSNEFEVKWNTIPSPVYIDGNLNNDVDIIGVNIEIFDAFSQKVIPILEEIIDRSEEINLHLVEIKIRGFNKIFKSIDELLNFETSKYLNKTLKDTNMKLYLVVTFKYEPPIKKNKEKTKFQMIKKFIGFNESKNKFGT